MAVTYLSLPYFASLTLITLSSKLMSETLSDNSSLLLKPVSSRVFRTTFSSTLLAADRSLLTSSSLKASTLLGGFFTEGIVTWSPSHLKNFFK